MYVRVTTPELIDVAKKVTKLLNARDIDYHYFSNYISKAIYQYQMVEFDGVMLSVDEAYGKSVVVKDGRLIYRPAYFDEIKVGVN